jgi:hypothetical protein
MTVRGSPTRDPRFHSVSVFYKMTVNVKASLDTKVPAKFLDLFEILLRDKADFAFDNFEILKMVYKEQ